MHKVASVAYYVFVMHRFRRLRTGALTCRAAACVHSDSRHAARSNITSITRCATRPLQGKRYTPSGSM